MSYNATARQKIAIARLCMALRIAEPIEEKRMSRGEAGRLIRLMVAEVKAQREGGDSWPTRGRLSEICCPKPASWHG
jgi:hypothetical protein